MVNLGLPPPLHEAEGRAVREAKRVEIFDRADRPRQTPGKFALVRDPAVQLGIEGRRSPGAAVRDGGEGSGGAGKEGGGND